MTDPEGLREAAKIAGRSSDLNTRNGAVIVRGQTACGIGANQFVQRLRMTEERCQYPLKNYFVAHAERCAIYDAAKVGHHTTNAVMFCLWAACPLCAQAIIECGISTVVTSAELNRQTPRRWAVEVHRGLSMLDEAGVEVRMVEGVGVVVRFDGREVEI